MCFGLEILGAVISAAGTMASAAAASNQAKTNAAIAEENAKSARMQGQVEADRIEDKYEAAKAQQRVAALKSGTDPNSGSASIIINQETERNSWLDQSTAVWNKETEAVGYENKAKQFKQEAKGIMIGGAFKAGSSILGGMGKPSYVPSIA